MIKIKIFLATLTLCIMSVGFSFADDEININRALDFDDNPYYFEQIVNGTNYIYTFKEIHFTTWYNLKGNVKLYINGSYNRDYTNGVTAPTSGELYTNHPTLVSYYTSKGYEITESKYGSSGAPIVPPTIAPTIAEALKGIVPTFSKQLLAYLPKALVIFSMVLSVPLIPRVIRLFF